MKKIFGLFLTVATAAIITSSCTKTCDPGYEGDKCTTEVRAKFVGQWKGDEVCTVGTDSYTIAVANSASDVQTITITNIYNQTFTATASATGTTFTAAANQTLATGVTLLSGSGSLTGNTLTFTYAIQAAGPPAITNNCTFTGTKL
ncbi:MAG: hypothetical protein IPP77_02580 [Bacteroidetes bacterium]|nr:hypothetical protein [Bacteroidota bacterium]